MDQVQKIIERIKSMLLQMGFEEARVTNPYRSEINFVHKNLYCIPQYIKSLGFILEYADSYEDAKKHGHEDGDIFPILLGEEAIIAGIRKEVENEMRDKIKE